MVTGVIRDNWLLSTSQFPVGGLLVVLFSSPTLTVNKQSYSISQQEYTWLPPALPLPAGAGSYAVDGVSPQPCRFPTPATLLTFLSLFFPVTLHNTFIPT